MKFMGQAREELFGQDNKLYLFIKWISTLKNAKNK